MATQAQATQQKFHYDNRIGGDPIRFEVMPRHGDPLPECDMWVGKWGHLKGGSLAAEVLHSGNFRPIAEADVPKAQAEVNAKFGWGPVNA